MVLTYHQLVTQECQYRYSLDAALFAAHMSLIGSLKNPPAVTFDDGHISQYRHTVSAMERHSLRGVFFVTVGWVGREHYMSWIQLKELHKRGHHIQSHGWSHKMFSDCSRAELREELRRSKAVLEDRLEAETNAISCPGGSWNPAVLDACAEVGYRAVYTSDAWSGVRNQNGMDIIGRLMVRRNCTTENLTSLINAEQEAFAPSRLQFAIGQAARKTLGLRLYHSLWCWLAKYTAETDAVR